MEIADGGRTKKPSPPPCVCECGRRIRVSPTVLAADPIACGVCGSDFIPEKREDEATGEHHVDPASVAAMAGGRR